MLILVKGGHPLTGHVQNVYIVNIRTETPFVNSTGYCVRSFEIIRLLQTEAFLYLITPWFDSHVKLEHGSVQRQTNNPVCKCTLNVTKAPSKRIGDHPGYVSQRYTVLGHTGQLDLYVGEPVTVIYLFTFYLVMIGELLLYRLS